MPDRPSLATWLLPENVHWSMRHVRELIPSERIAAGPAPRVLGSAPRPELLDLEVDSHAGLVPLESLLGAPMELGQFLRLAIGIAALAIIPEGLPGSH